MIPVKCRFRVKIIYTRRRGNKTGCDKLKGNIWWLFIDLFQIIGDSDMIDNISPGHRGQETN